MLWSVAARRRQRRRKRQPSTGDDSDMRSAGVRSTQRVVSKWAALSPIFIHRKFGIASVKRGSDEGPPVSREANRRDRSRASRSDPRRCLRWQTIQSSVRGDRLVAACVVFRHRHRRHGRHTAVAAIRACLRKSSATRHRNSDSTDDAFALAPILHRARSKQAATWRSR